MAKLRRRTIRKTFFLYSFAGISAVIVLSMALYYLSMSGGFIRNYAQSAQQLARLISVRLDDTVRALDNLEKRVLESDTVRKYVFEELPRSEGADIYLRQRAFEQAVYAIAGYELGFWHMSIHTLSGDAVEFGQQFSFAHGQASDQRKADVFDPVFAMNGSKYLSAPGEPKLFGPGGTVAVSRAFSRYPLNQPKAVIEMQFSPATIGDAISDMLASYDTLSARVAVFDAKDRAICPADLDPAAIAGYRAALPMDSAAPRPNPLTGQSELVAAHASPYTRYTTLVITPYDQVAAGARRYLTLTLLLGGLALAVACALSYRLAFSLSAPIERVRDGLQGLRLDTLNQSELRLNSPYNELELVEQAFGVMRSRLDSALADHVRLSTLSIQSRMQALKSQMNPHFLYNSLSIIAILAEEQGDMEVAKMLNQLVGMLRYGISEADHTTFARELGHARAYAQLMQVRFGDKIKFTFDVEAMPGEAVLPPMLLQPLMENAVKYGRAEGGLAVNIVAQARDGRWTIAVTDNGGGFSDQALGEIRRHMDTWDQATGEPGGIGLVNIYARMRLYYKEAFVFDIHNTDAGAGVTVGGALHLGGEGDG